MTFGDQMTTEHNAPLPMQPPSVADDNDRTSASAINLSANDNDMLRVANDNNTMAAAPAHRAAAVTMQRAPETSALGSWFARNRWFTHEPVTYLSYQFIRSTFATVAYGFMMALGFQGFNTMGAKGQLMGLTKKGLEEFGKGGVLGVDKLAAASAEARAELYQKGAKGVLGRNMMRLGASPMNAAVQIALGFTLFRFVGGIVKNLRDRIINDRNTEQETIHETKSWWQTIKETARINWVAESTATPIAALVLGFINGSYTPPAAGHLPNPVKGESFWQGIKRSVFHPSAKLFQNAMTWTISYSLFFLLAECLFKDKQIQRGVWKGHPNSLKNGPDDVVGGPGAIHYVTPEDDPAKSEVSNDLAEAGYRKQISTKTNSNKKDDKAKDSTEKLAYPFFTGEPSWGRFIFRRVLPVCLGISAYAALKRVGYLAAGGTMEGISAKKFSEELWNPAHGWGETIVNNAKLLGQNWKREGIATATFGALWASTDFFGEVYDKFFHKLQKPENQVPLNDNQQKHHQDLLVRLNEKFPVQGQGRAA